MIKQRSKRSKTMNLWNRHKKGLLVTLCATTLLTAGGMTAGALIVQSYQQIPVKKIENFETIWNRVWNPKAKQFNSKLIPTVIRQLEAKAVTPTQREQLRLAKASVGLVRVFAKDATIDQFISASNDYIRQNDADDHFKEQEAINKDRLAKINTFIKSVNHTLEHISIYNQHELTYDKEIRDKKGLLLDKLNPRGIKWDATEKATVNHLIGQFDQAINQQIAENKKKDTAQTIISLKGKLNQFLQQVSQLKQTIATNYIDGKTVQKIKKALTDLEIDKHRNWFTTIEPLTTSKTDYTTTFSAQFFEDHADLKSYQVVLSQIVIPVRVQKETTSDSSYEQFGYNLATNLNLDDDNLLLIESLKNSKISISQTQYITKEKPRTSTTPSTRSTVPSTESTVSSSTTDSSGIADSSSSLSSSSNNDLPTPSVSDD